MTGLAFSFQIQIQIQIRQRSRPAGVTLEHVPSCADSRFWGIPGNVEN